MARKRMIDPEFFLDEEISKLTPYARLLYIGLWGICDDTYATFPDRPDWIKAQIFPYENVDILSLFKEIMDKKKIIGFKHKNNKYWYVKNFHKYQRIDRPSKPKYPPYPRALAEHSPSTRLEVKLREVKLKEVKGGAPRSIEGAAATITENKKTSNERTKAALKKLKEDLIKSKIIKSK